MSLNPYPEMKPSGIAWLGNVPKHWTVKRLRYACEINPVKSEVASLPDDQLVSFLPMEKVGTNGELVRDDIRAISDVYQGFTYFRDDDVIVAKITPCFENGKGAVCSGLINGIGFGSTEFHVLRPNREYSSHYIYYLTKSDPFRNAGEELMQGAAGQKRVPEDFVKNFEIGFPPLPEQQTIAAYLDRKIAQIDAIVREKEEQIRLLAEQRQAVISHAVTRGLDPNAPLKPSGIVWLGDIPMHWEIVRLKYLSSIKYGLGQPPSQQEEGIPLLRATNVERGKINPLGLMFIDPNDVPYSRDPILKARDILVVRSGAYTGDSAIVPSEYDGAIAGYDMVVRTKGDNPYYLAYSLLSDPILINQLHLQRLRAAQPHLNAEELADCLFFMPPLPEQEAIVKYLDTETARLDGIMQTLTQQIGELREYRQALISAVVTGKVDVRENLR